MRHYYNEMDGALMEAVRPRPVGNSSNQMESYSSPYTVKVLKEVAKQRREEVDLETGKRKSWVETTEFEVLDLTGETPVKKLSLRKSPLKETNEIRKTNANNIVKKKLTEVPVVDPGTCPICGRTFKGEKGVNCHRRARNSPCHPDKENQGSQARAETVTLLDAVSQSPELSPLTVATTSAEDSIIIIPDTPVVGSRRLSLRRSIRMA